MAWCGLGNESSPKVAKSIIDIKILMSIIDLATLGALEQCMHIRLNSRNSNTKKYTPVRMRYEVTFVELNFFLYPIYVIIISCHHKPSCKEI